MRDLTGVTIGQYTVGEQLGGGGMANVYKAYHAGLDVHRAIKIIRPELSGFSNFDERFQREARAVAALRHPNIVQIHDFGRHDELFYMVMEFVEGEDLKVRIRRQGPIRPFAEAVRILEELASALGYAHERNILHRDVKPDNLLLSTEGHVILTDFGIAKILGSDDPQLTATGAGIGTPYYMAPELAMGQVQTSASSDLYAAGVVLYEMLTARVPFSADTPLAVLHKVVNDPVPPPRNLTADIPEALQAVVLKAMAYDPADRYPDAEALIEACHASLTEPDPDAATPPATQPMLSRAIDDAATDQPAATVPSPPPAATVPASPPTAVSAGVAKTVVSTPPSKASSAAGGGGGGETHPAEGEPAEAVAPPIVQPATRGRRDLFIAGGLALLLLLLLGVAAVSGWRWLQDRLSAEIQTVAELVDPETDSRPAEKPQAPIEEEPGLAMGAEREPGAVEPEESRLELETFAGGQLTTGAPTGAAAGETSQEPLGSSDSDSRLSPPRDTERISGEARDRAGLGEVEVGLPPLPATVATGGRTYDGGTIRFGQPVAGVLDPADTAVYDIEVRRPTHIYFDIFATRPAVFTLFDADGNEVFRRSSDLGPFLIENAGWYRLSIETDAQIPIDYQVEFLQVGR